MTGFSFSNIPGRLSPELVRSDCPKWLLVSVATLAIAAMFF